MVGDVHQVGDVQVKTVSEEQQRMKDITAMAGFFAGHGLHSVVDFADEDVLVPILGLLDDAGKRNLIRLPVDASKLQELSNKEIQEGFDADKIGAVLVQDGRIEYESTKVDALIIKVTFKADSKTSIDFAIPYRKATSSLGFAVHRMQVTGLEGIEIDKANDFAEVFVAGIESHEEGGEIWRNRFADKPTDPVEGASGEASSAGGAEASGDNFQQKLKQAPILIFLLVSAIDGNVDDKEKREFFKILTNPQQFNNTQLTKLLQETTEELPSILQNLMQQPIDYLDELKQLREAIDANMPKEEAYEFKQALFKMGKIIAEASGGFFGFGSKISKEEKAALGAIAYSLEITPRK